MWKEIQAFLLKYKFVVLDINKTTNRQKNPTNNNQKQNNTTTTTKKQQNFWMQYRETNSAKTVKSLTWCALFLRKQHTQFASKN